MKLIPEARQQMLWEADQLIGDLPLVDSQRVLISLETLQEHTEEDLQDKIQQILNNHLSLDIRNVLELSIQNTTLPAAV
jgi:hypothetical protein